MNELMNEWTNELMQNDFWTEQECKPRSIPEFILVREEKERYYLIEFLLF